MKMVAQEDEEKIDLKKFSFGSYPVQVAHKIQKISLEKFHCVKVGDCCFVDAKRTWYRVLKEVTIQECDERRLLSCSLERDGARVFESVASVHWNSSTDEL